jgi:hypothetical protein
MTAAPLRLHAVYVVLDEVALFRASVASIYSSVERITVVTAHDRDWAGTPRAPSGIVATVLDRECDPDRKIDLIVMSETNEARARNRAMDFAAPRSASLRVRRQHDRDPSYLSPDYFLIVDADEIYEAGTLERLSTYISRDRKPLYRVPCVRYFKRWNYRIDGHEWTIALVRADQRLPYLRLRRPSVVRRVAARVPRLPRSWRERLLGYVDIPPEVGVFHHGSYVGPRSRIEAKLQSFGHAHEVDPSWIDDVWDVWTPGARDFNPAYPDLFPSATHVPVHALPAEIVSFGWPAEYLEP